MTLVYTLLMLAVTSVPWGTHLAWEAPRGPAVTDPSVAPHFPAWERLEIVIPLPERHCDMVLPSFLPWRTQIVPMSDVVRDVPSKNQGGPPPQPARPTPLP
jgi:hypothetical protein